MLSCREITELVSIRLENENMTWYQKMEVTVHLMMCKRCHRYAKQLHFLQTAFKSATEKATNLFLSDDARKRIKQKLNEANRQEQ